MPRYLPIHRGGVGTNELLSALTEPIPGTRYGYAPRVSDFRGAQAYEGMYRGALLAAQHEASQEYARLHHELEIAKIRSELVRDEALAQQRMRYEAMMQQAIPRLYAIDPADPQAAQKRAAIAADFPQLFHNEKGLPSIAPQFESHQRLSQESVRQREAEQTRKDAAAKLAQDRADAAALRAQERADKDKEKADEKAQTQKAIEDVKASGGRISKITAGGVTYETPETIARKNAPSKAVVDRYGVASAQAASLKDRLEKNQAFIDELEARNTADSKTPLSEEEQKRLVALRNSHRQIESDYNKQAGIAEGLEMVHPELNPKYVPKDKTDSSDDKETMYDSPIGPPGTAAPTDVTNPNVTESVTPAPVPTDATGEDTTTDLSTLAPPPTGADTPPPATATAPTPHPLEGKRVKHKETGQMGVITNGQFIPDDTTTGIGTDTAD